MSKDLNKKNDKVNNSPKDNNYSESEVNTGLLRMALEDTELMQNLELEKESGNTFKNPFLVVSKIRIFAMLICIILIAILQVVIGVIKNKQIEQNTADRWIPEGGACAVSVFLEYHDPIANNQNSDNTSGGGQFLTPIEINSLRYTFNNKLKELVDDEDSKNIDESNSLEGPYTYAYSSRGTVTVASGNDDNHIINDANVYGVGGDFFIFHPIELLSGSYFSDSDAMNDGIILDANSAFRLFGSSDIVGQMVTIGGVAHYVRGVYAPDDSHLSTLAGSDGGFIFMSYSSLYENGNVGAIDCLEFVSLEPYKGYMKTFFNDRQNTGFTEGKYKVVQNTKRFGIESLFNDVILNWNIRSMQTSNIVYPYWENIARVYEGIAAFILIIQSAFLLIFVILLFSTFNLILKKTDFEALKKTVSDKVYDFKVKNKKQG